MNEKDFRRMMAVIKLHYQSGLSQDEIARRVYLSKSSVSRLIKKATELGYVEFKIKDPGQTVQGLQQELSDEFGAKCTVLPTYVDEYLVRLNDVCSYAAAELENYIEDGGIVGVTWGRTTEYLANNLSKPLVPKKDVKVCMMSGFVTGTIISMKSTHIIEKMVDIFGAQGYVMPAPLLVDSSEIAQTLYSDSNIRFVADLSLRAQTVIVSVGGINLTDSLLTDRQSYNLSVYNKIAHSGGVGDIGGRNFDIYGQEVKTNITDRIISLPLSELKSKKHRICIAVGSHKTSAILGALRGKLINRLYTDEITARDVLQEHKRCK